MAHLPKTPAEFDITSSEPVVDQQVIWAETPKGKFIFPNSVCDQTVEEWTEMREVRDQGPSANADAEELRLYNEAVNGGAPWNKPPPDPYFHPVVAGDSGLVLGRILVSSQTTYQFIIDEANRIAKESGYYNNIWKAHPRSLNQWSEAGKRELLVMKPWDVYSFNVMQRGKQGLLAGVIGLLDFCDCDKWKYEPIVVSPGFATLVQVEDLEGNFRTIMINNYVTFEDIIKRCKWWYAGRADIRLNKIELKAVDGDGFPVVFSKRSQDATVPYWIDIPAQALVTTHHLHKISIRMYLR